MIDIVQEEFQGDSDWCLSILTAGAALTPDINLHISKIYSNVDILLIVAQLTLSITLIPILCRECHKIIL